MLEEDALDAILAQAKDGNLLSFDGMDEAMMEMGASLGEDVVRPRTSEDSDSTSLVRL